MVNIEMGNDYVTEENAQKVKELCDNDLRLNTLRRQFRKAVKKNDSKKQAEIQAEIEERQMEISDKFIADLIHEDEKNRKLAKYMSGEKAELYNEQRDAMCILLDAMETVFMDMKDLVYESTNFVVLEFPKSFEAALKDTRAILKEDFSAVDNEAIDRYSEESDKLLEHLYERIKLQRKLLTERNKLKKVTL